MKLTRKEAIKSIVAFMSVLFGAARQVYPQSGFLVEANGEPLLELSFGKTLPEAEPPECAETQDSGFILGRCRRKDSTIQGVSFSSARYAPGTATGKMRLDGFESFTFTNAGESVTISRQEVWDALKS